MSAPMSDERLEEVRQLMYRDRSMIRDLLAEVDRLRAELAQRPTLGGVDPWELLRDVLARNISTEAVDYDRHRAALAAHDAGDQS